jgi:nucleoside-diphosphate kinase
LLPNHAYSFPTGQHALPKERNLALIKDHKKTVNKMLSHTLAILKPTAVKEAHTGQMLAHIEKEGFVIKQLTLSRLSLDEAKAFYSIHVQRPFYLDLCNYMSSGPVVVCLLQKEHAVADFRTLIGDTNPATAAPDTLRAIYGKSIDHNAVHGSDSDDNAAIEISFFFVNRAY